MRIAVTGGTGFIGSHVVDCLLERGHEVSCLVRPGKKAAWIGGKAVDFHEGSILEPASLPGFLEGCDALIHLAGLTRAKTEADFLAINLEGSRNLIEAALALSSPPKQIVVMSSLAASGPGDPSGACLEEDTPQKPLTAYGRSKLALEELVRARGEALPYTIIRAPGVYGPRDRDFLTYFRLVERGLRVILGARSLLSIVYVKTLAAAIVDCLLKPEAYGQAFFIADEGAYDWDQFSTMVEGGLGKRTRRLKLPDWSVELAMVLSTFLGAFSKNPPLLSKDKVLEMRQPCWVVSTEKAKRLLGFKALLPSQEAIRETAEWYRAQGWL